MVYAAMVVGGVFLDGGAPLFFELVIEVSYPVGEGVTSGCLQMICAGAGVFFLSLVQIKSIGQCVDVIFYFSLTSQSYFVNFYTSTDF